MNPLLGVTAIPPAQWNFDLSLTFPAVGGTVGPDGKRGRIIHAGGTQINRDPANHLGACASVPDGVNVRQTDPWLELRNDVVFVRTAINGYPLRSAGTRAWRSPSTSTGPTRRSTPIPMPGG